LFAVIEHSDTETGDDEKMTSFPKNCIFWVNRPTQNLTGWKRWVLVENVTPF